MESTLHQLRSTQAAVHPFCMVCSGSNPYGLALKFTNYSEGILQAIFQPNPTLEGYSGLLHGGIAASLLDGIMTNCLFAHGIVALTAELRVRYEEPVTIGPEILLRAWLEKQRPPLFLMGAELVQENNVRVSATAKFMTPGSG
jgi:acyl-coenzyme A thioesterase PaaI-like protein